LADLKVPLIAGQYKTLCLEKLTKKILTMSDLLNQHLQKTLKKSLVKVTQPIACPTISLYLFDPAVLEGPISHDEAQAIVAEPAYWSFCWASGQVLAQYLLIHPEYVKGKVVVDFGSGSGIVAIAAALAGAEKVFACDIDMQALNACAINAKLNKVAIYCIPDFNLIDDDIDLIVAADVLYDKDNYPLLDMFLSKANQVLLADSRVKVLPSDHYQQIECIEARTWPDLNEFEEFNQVRLYLSDKEQKK
jgi:predicted nicotinamide N-methyase